MWPTIKRLAMLRRGAKPNNVLEAALRKKLSGGHIVWKTVGPAAILTVTDAVAAPAQSLVAHIAPVQEGSGDPSPDNIRPITGRTGVTVYQSGADTSDPTTISVSWQSEAGTVYGGTVDLVSGVLTVRNIGIAFDGTEDWKAPVDAGYFLYIINASTDYGVSNTGICSHLPLATNISGSNSVTGFRPYGRSVSPSGFVVIMRFDPTKQQTLTEFKNYLSTQDTAGTPVTVMYELSEPQTYQLSPQTIQMLRGANTLWSDADNITLTYAAKTAGELAEDQLMLLGAIQQGLVRPGTVSLDGVDLSRLDLSRIDGIGTLDPIDIQPIKPGGIKA